MAKVGTCPTNVCTSQSSNPSNQSHTHQSLQHQEDAAGRPCRARKRRHDRPIKTADKYILLCRRLSGFEEPLHWTERTTPLTPVSRVRVGVCKIWQRWFLKRAGLSRTATSTGFDSQMEQDLPLEPLFQEHCYTQMGQDLPLEPLLQEHCYTHIAAGAPVLAPSHATTAPPFINIEMRQKISDPWCCPACSCSSVQRPRPPYVQYPPFEKRVVSHVLLRRLQRLSLPE